MNSRFPKNFLKHYRPLKLRSVVICFSNLPNSISINQHFKHSYYPGYIILLLPHLFNRFQEISTSTIRLQTTRNSTKICSCNWDRASLHAEKKNNSHRRLLKKQAKPPSCCFKAKLADNVLYMFLPTQLKIRTSVATNN